MWTRRRLVGRLAPAALLLAATTVGPLANASSPERGESSTTPFDLSQLHAKYKYVGGEAQRKQITVAIEAGIKGLPSGLLSLARRRISKTQQPWKFARFDIDGRDIRVERGPEKAVHTTAAKPKFVMFNRMGERYVWRQSTQGRTLKQTVSGLGNKTKISYRFNEDGSRLTFKIAIDADLLPRPISYQLSYARIDA